jgi:hypothetical protein
VETNPRSAEEDIRQIRVLIDQSASAVTRAEADGDIETGLANRVRNDLDRIAASLSTETLRDAANTLIGACRTLDSP